ncbi:MAG: o-succinylbenzoate synthase [Calditrichaeota bacterium]|nr:MAG: o-succinylbenzoate synthase [Calditrichota bacterium]
MQIREITLREIKLPLREVFAASHGEIRTRRLIIVEMRDEENRSGWGECAALETPGYLPETIDISLIALKNWLAPAIIKMNFSHPKQFAEFIAGIARGFNFAKASLEMASWDLFAKDREKSLAELFGGTRKKVAVGKVIGLQKSPQILVEKAIAAVEKGYKRLKIKIMPDADLAYFHALRSSLGQDVDLAADANSAYSSADFSHLQKFDAFNLSMIEQPLGWNDHFHHAELQKVLNTPICLDESICSFADCQTMLAMGSGKIVNIKPGRVGGLVEALKIHDLCVKKDIPVWCGGMLESGIGRGFNIALASLPGFTLPGDLSPSTNYFRNDIVSPEWQMDESGFIAIPYEKTGIGCEVNLDYLEKVTVGKFKFK